MWSLSRVRKKFHSKLSIWRQWYRLLRKYKKNIKRIIKRINNAQHQKTNGQHTHTKKRMVAGLIRRCLYWISAKHSGSDPPDPAANVVGSDPQRSSLSVAMDNISEPSHLHHMHDAENSHSSSSRSAASESSSLPPEERDESVENIYESSLSSAESSVRAGGALALPTGEPVEISYESSLSHASAVRADGDMSVRESLTRISLTVKSLFWRVWN